MRTPVGFIGAAAVVAALGMTTAPAPAVQLPVFHAAVDSVELNVTVVSGNKPVGGLTIYDFEVADNGVPQQVLTVSRETMPVDVTLVIDTSGSVTGDLIEAIVNAANKIRDRLRSADRLALVTFNQGVHQRFALQSTASVKSVSIGFTGGWTSLNDAIAVALTMPPPPERRQMAIVFTDGYDTMSFLDEASVLDVAGRGRTAVFVVAKAVDPSAVPVAFFEKLADVTGGGVQLVSNEILRVESPGLFGSGARRVRLVPNRELLDRAFLQALDDFRTSYVVRYLLAGVPRAGWHDVTVRVTKAGKTYDVRTRKGYQG